MAYTDTEARELILKTIPILLKDHFISPHLGNISARISDDEFIITSKDKDFSTISQDDLVKVSFSKNTYKGSKVPSRDYDIHTAIYQVHNDVNFIIHTHQKYALVVSTYGKDLPFVPVVSYTPPYSRFFKSRIIRKIYASPHAKGLLIAGNSSLFFGPTMGHAYNEANMVELFAKDTFEKRHYSNDYSNRSNKVYLDDYAKVLGVRGKCLQNDIELLNEIRERNNMASTFGKHQVSLSLLNVYRQHKHFLKHLKKLKKHS